MSEGLEHLPVMLDDLEMFRTTLLAVQTYLEAQDMAKCQLNMFGEMKFSPLTQDVQHGVKRIEGIVGDHLVAKHFADAQVMVDAAHGEEVPVELSESPLGRTTIPKAKRMVADDAERVE